MSSRRHLVAWLPMALGALTGLAGVGLGLATAGASPPEDRAGHLRQVQGCGPSERVVHATFELAPAPQQPVRPPVRAQSAEEAVDKFMTRTFPRLSALQRTKSLERDSLRRFAVLDGGEPRLLIDAVQYGSGWAVNGFTGCGDLVAKGRQGVR